MKNKIIVGAILIIGAVFAYLFFIKTPTKSVQTKVPTSVTQTDKPQVVSTVPDSLEDTIVPATQVVEITFNRSLENSGEFKLKIEPKIDFKIELSQDRKTARIITSKPYELGSTYTLFIGPETKFDGVGRWGEEKVFHIHTIKYRGV